MTERTTNGLIRELSRELAPVRPIPRLRAVGAAALVAWLAGLGLERALGGAALPLRGGGAWSDPVYLGQLAGLAFLALGATGAALATVVPGRENAMRAASRIAALGFTLALAAGLWGLASQGANAGTADLRAWLACTYRALGLGLAPILLASAFALHAVVRRRPLATAGLALAGGIALGACAVHTTCPSGNALHQVLAHVLAPMAAAAASTVPLAMLLGRRARAQHERAV